MLVQCSKGHRYYATWDNLNQGKCCRECYRLGFEKQVETRAVQRKNKSREEHRVEMYQLVRAYLERHGYKLLVDQYENNHTKFSVVCPRGHTWENGWNGFQQGKRCRHCWIEDSRKSLDEVRAILRSEGCELVGEYRGDPKIDFEPILRTANGFGPPLTRSIHSQFKFPSK